MYVSYGPHTVQPRNPRYLWTAAVCAACREAASCVAAQFSPLHQWHAQQVQRRQEAAVQAQQWWQSTDRLKAAIAGATSPHHQQHHNSSSTATAADGGAAPSSSNGSSSNPGMWPSGGYNCHPECPLCRQEQQQQDTKPHDGAYSTSSSSGGDSGSSGSNSGSDGSSPYTAWAVGYDDPFLWRRLMWQLLGKLNPQAQAFYATYLAICPHCTDQR